MASVSLVGFVRVYVCVFIIFLFVRPLFFVYITSLLRFNFREKFNLLDEIKNDLLKIMQYFVEKSMSVWSER